MTTANIRPPLAYLLKRKRSRCRVDAACGNWASVPLCKGEGALLSGQMQRCTGAHKLSREAHVGLQPPWSGILGHFELIREVERPAEAAVRHRCNSVPFPDTTCWHCSRG